MMLVQWVLREGQPLDREAGRFALIAGLTVACFSAGAIAIMTWRRAHFSGRATWVRSVDKYGVPTSPWQRISLLPIILAFGSLPVGIVALPYYTVMGFFVAPFRSRERVLRHRRERKAI